MQPRNRPPHGFIVALTLLSVCCATVQGAVLHVNAAAVGANTGASWTDAHIDLQAALYSANSGDQIWVASGTYTPTSVNGNLRATFTIKNGIALYGGFAGNETDVASRDPVARLTILSGDIDRDDASNVANNSFHVVTASGTNTTAILDGFVIQGGDAHRAFPDDEGGGMYLVGGSPTIRNCTFRENLAFTGAGMFSLGGQPTLANCTFVGNSAFAAGGGLHNLNGSPTLTGTRFQGNTAGAFGGGLYHVGQGSPNLISCSFMDNAANTRGGGAYFGGSGVPTLTQCEFETNQADEGGGLFNLGAPSVLRGCLFSQNVAFSSGGGLSLVSSDPQLEDCRFTQNSASDGGAVACLDGSPTVIGCAFEENLAEATGGAIVNLDCDTTIRRSQFDGNRSEDGGAVYNLSGHPSIRECDFHGNTAELSGGAISNDASDAEVVETTLTDNTVLSISGDGGAIWNLSSDATIEHCILRGNAAGRGGAISNLAGSPTVSNTLFNGNSASFGGAMFNDGANPTVANVTVVGNQAGIGGGFATFNGTRLTLTNGILWGNRDSVGIIRLAQLYAENSPSVVNYSCVEGLTGTLGGSGNIGLDPLFVDTDGADDMPGTADDSFQLSLGSPCNDAGDNASVARDGADLDGDGDVVEAVPFSLEGNPRFLDDPLTADRGRGTPPIVDLGAFEHRSPVRFVQRDATGIADGSDWTNAYPNLQDALTDARGSNGVVTMIWVAAGTYPPAPPAGERRSTFRLPDGVAIYGGFAGGEKRLSERDVNENPTVLTGDLNGDDLPGFGSTAENAFHVVTADNVDDNTRLDGFVIRGGNANEVCNECFATGGGGLLLINSNLRVANCTIEENQATVGGGIVINGGEPVLSGCTILGNTASGSPSVGDVGGGGLVANASSPLLVNCRVLGNSTLRDGGGVYVSGAGAPRLVNCVLSGNSAGAAGGGMLVLGGRPVLSNCTINGNRADHGGGGIGNFLSGNPTITNSILWDNEESGRRDESTQILSTSPTIGLSFSCVQGLTGALRGVGNIGTNPSFNNAAGPDGQVGTEDDDPRLRPGSSCIDSGANAGVALDIADLDQDGNRSEPTPFDLDGLPRATDSPAVPDHGAGAPPVVDMGAYEFQPDTDCLDDGIVDDDQVPQSGSVSSTWIGTSGLWSVVPLNRNWCLPESPDNNGVAIFSVDIPGSDAVVTLNTSPTIASLTLGTGTELVVNDASGANVRTLSVDGPIQNYGALRATDRERLILDAPEINQHGPCGSGGIIEAVDGNVGALETEGKSIVEINGSRVIGGVVRAVGAASEIHLIGGAELVDSCAEGVVVPDGQTGRFSGTVFNESALRIDGVSDTTRLEPGAVDPVLAGTGRVRLGSQVFSRLGDFKNSFTNALEHHIEGEGIVFGGMTNLGTLQADVPGAQLILFPPGQKRNDGEFRAINGGTLRIATTVVGNGSFVADAATIVVEPDGASTLLTGSQLRVSGEFVGDDLRPGLFEVQEDATVAFTGATNVGLGGALFLRDASLFSSSGTIELVDNDSTCCCLVRSTCIIAGGQTPPLKLEGQATLTAFGGLSMTGAVASSNTSSVPVTVGGDFDNRSTCSPCFDWLEGALRLDGLAPQSIEVAGRDFGPEVLGFEANFGFGRLEIAANALVNVIDAFNNQQDGETSASSSEAQYVGTLSLEPGSRLEIRGGALYYCELQNNGGSIPSLGTNVRRIHADTDCNRRIDLTDFESMSACWVGSTSPDCLELFDMDDDGSIDLEDFARFQNLFAP